MLSAPPSAASLEFLNSLLIVTLLGGLRVLVLLAATEVADADVTVAHRASRWRHLRAGAVVAGLAMVKAVLLVLGFTGVFGDRNRGETWDIGVWAQWAFSVLLVALACAVFLAARARPFRPEHLGAVTTQLVIGFGLPGLVLLALAYFQVASGALLPGRWQSRVSDHVLDANLLLTRFSPLGTVIIAGAIGVVLLARRGRTDGAVLGVAAFAVGLPMAAQIAMVHDGAPLTRSLLSLPILDAVVTAALLVALGISAIRRQWALPVRDLLIILVASSLLSFTVDALIPESIQSRLFALALLAPVVWRFAVDTRGEQQRPVHRTVLSMVGWSGLLAVSGLALAHGYAHEQWGTEDKLAWRLIAIPLAFVLLCRRSQRPTEPAPGWRTAPPPVARPSESRLVYAAGAFTALLLAGAASLAMAGSLEVPRVERTAHAVSTPLPRNWQPAQCPSQGDAEVVALLPDDGKAFILAGHGVASVVDRTLAQCPLTNEVSQLTLYDPRCTGATTDGIRTIEAAGMTGVEFHTDTPQLRGVVRCAHVTADGIKRFVVAADTTPGIQRMRPALTSAIERITFTSR